MTDSVIRAGPQSISRRRMTSGLLLQDFDDNPERDAVLKDGLDYGDDDTLSEDCITDRDFALERHDFHEGDAQDSSDDDEEDGDDDDDDDDGMPWTESDELMAPHLRGLATELDEFLAEEHLQSLGSGRFSGIRMPNSIPQCMPGKEGVLERPRSHFSIPDVIVTDCATDDEGAADEEASERLRRDARKQSMETSVPESSYSTCTGEEDIMTVSSKGYPVPLLTDGRSRFEVRIPASRRRSYTFAKHSKDTPVIDVISGAEDGVLADRRVTVFAADNDLRGNAEQRKATASVPNLASAIKVRETITKNGVGSVQSAKGKIPRTPLHLLRRRTSSLKNNKQPKADALIAFRRVDEPLPMEVILKSRVPVKLPWVSTSSSSDEGEDGFSAQPNTVCSSRHAEPHSALSTQHSSVSRAAGSVNEDAGLPIKTKGGSFGWGSTFSPSRSRRGGQNREATIRERRSMDELASAAKMVVGERERKLLKKKSSFPLFFGRSASSRADDDRMSHVDSSKRTSRGGSHVGTPSDPPKISNEEDSSKCTCLATTEPSGSTLDAIDNSDSEQSAVWGQCRSRSIVRLEDSDHKIPRSHMSSPNRSAESEGANYAAKKPRDRTATLSSSMSNSSAASSSTQIFDAKALKRQRKALRKEEKELMKELERVDKMVRQHDAKVLKLKEKEKLMARAADAGAGEGGRKNSSDAATTSSGSGPDLGRKKMGTKNGQQVIGNAGRRLLTRLAFLGHSSRAGVRARSQTAHEQCGRTSLREGLAVEGFEQKEQPKRHSQSLSDSRCTLDRSLTVVSENGSGSSVSAADSLLKLQSREAKARAALRAALTAPEPGPSRGLIVLDDVVEAQAAIKVLAAATGGIDPNKRPSEECGPARSRADEELPLFELCAAGISLHGTKHPQSTQRDWTDTPLIRSPVDYDVNGFDGHVEGSDESQTEEMTPSTSADGSCESYASLNSASELRLAEAFSVDKKTSPLAISPGRDREYDGYFPSRGLGLGIKGVHIAVCHGDGDHEPSSSYGGRQSCSPSNDSEDMDEVDRALSALEELSHAASALGKSSDSTARRTEVLSQMPAPPRVVGQKRDMVPYVYSETSEPRTHDQEPLVIAVPCPRIAPLDLGHTASGKPIRKPGTADMAGFVFPRPATKTT